MPEPDRRHAEPVMHLSRHANCQMFVQCIHGVTVAHRATMSNMLPPSSVVHAHPSSVDAYIRHGWSLVPIPYRSKAPITPGWNKRENTLRSHVDLPAGGNVGLAHAYSGTMALDIDDYEITAFLLAEHGVDISALFNAPDAVTIDSGRSGHGKLLYAMPFGLTLQSKQVYGPFGAAYNFRCASVSGTTVQDVLPPSTHPDTGMPYRWGGKGHWSRLPVLPAPLLDVWQSLLTRETVRSVPTEGSDISWDDIRTALAFVSPDCRRKEWIDIGMALHWAASQQGDVDSAYHLWDDWSAQSIKYPGPKATTVQWESFRSDKPTAVTMGTFWHHARQGGWTPPAPDVSTLFSATATPVVMLDDLQLAPPSLDITLFPPVLATRAREVSDSVGCDPLVPLFSGLGAVCAAVDARSRLTLVEGFKVPPILWLMTIGDPADKKTPGSRPMMGILKEIEIEDRPRHQKAMVEWEAKEAAYAAAKKAFVEFGATPEAMLGATPPPVPELPQPPASLKLTISDITSQKLVRHAAERPGGSLCYLDEMNGWVKKLTDRMSGEDRSAWVVSYESQPYDMDRVGGGSVNVENFAISIYGNIQPRVLKESLTSLASDGLLQRFIPAVLNSENTRLGNPIPDCMTNKAQWDQTIRTIHALPPIDYKLSADAYVQYRAFQAWYESAKKDEKLAGTGDLFMTAFGKLEGTVGRLILLFHILEQPLTHVVESDIVSRVIILAKEYLIPAFRHVFCNEKTDPLYVWVRDYILQNCDRERVAMTDIKRSGRVQFDGMNPWQQSNIIMSAMQMLETAQWVARTDDGSREHLHKAEWIINPALKDQFRDQRRKVIEAKQRILDRIQRTSENKRKVAGYESAMDEQ